MEDREILIEILARLRMEAQNRVIWPIKEAQLHPENERVEIEGAFQKEKQALESFKDDIRYGD